MEQKQQIKTYDEMNIEIINLLRIGGTPADMYAAQRIEELELANQLMQEALEIVIKNDKTTYKHHEKRPFDSKKPEESGGTIWLTPKEIAYGVFNSIGIRPPFGTD